MATSNNAIPFIGKLVYNGYAPKEGPKVLPVPFVFANPAAALEFDLYREETEGYMSYVQSAFFDNSANAAAITFAARHVAGMNIVLPPNSQGVFPFYMDNPAKFTINTATASFAGTLLLANFPQPYAVWKTV